MVYRLSREGHTVPFYAIFRGKAVSFLSEEEQSIAGLLFRSYQKRYQVWHPEWKECQEEFMSKHGKKKDASSKIKSKANPSKAKKTPLPSNNDAASKPRRSSKVPTNILSKTPSSVPKPRDDDLKRSQEAQGPPKPTSQNEVATANTPAPLAPSNSVPKVSTGVRGNQINTPRNSMAAPAKPGMQQARPVSSFASYRPPRVPSGSESGSALDATVKEQSSKPPQAPYPGGPSSTVPAKAPMVQRRSWDIFSSLASGSPAPAQTVQSQKAPASTQSFQTFQPFSAAKAQKTSSPSPSVSVPFSEFEKRYSASSLNSQGQPRNSGSASASPASQYTPAQAYRTFGAASQKPNMSQQQINGPYQKPVDPVATANPPMLEPAPTHTVTAHAQGGMPPQQPQAAPGVVQPQKARPQRQVQTHPQRGKTAPVPSKSQAPLGATQAQVARPQVQTQAQIGKPAPVPPKSHTPTGAVQPQTAKPQAQNGKAEPQAHRMQGPPGTSQIPLGKPQGQGGLPLRKPQVPTSKVQSQPAKPSIESGTSAQKHPSAVTSAKPSATPAQAQKATPGQRKPVPSYTGSGPGGVDSPTSIPAQGSTGQRPHHMPGDKIAAAAGVGVDVLAGAAGGYFLPTETHEDHPNSSIADDSSYIHMDAVMSQQSAYGSDGESETHVELSESSNEANSINDSGSDGFLSDEEYELSDSEVSRGQASSDDEISDWGESDAESIHEDPDFDELDLDSPYISADFTDSEVSEAEDLGARDWQAEPYSDLNTDPGQASSVEDPKSDEKESRNNESEDEFDESAQSMGSFTNQLYQRQGYLNEHYQQLIPEEPGFEEYLQPNFQSSYQKQGYFNGQYQQQAAQQSDSEEDEPQDFHQQYQQQSYYNQHHQIADQVESEEDEPQNFQSQQQQQSQSYYGGHPQNQAFEQSESEEEPYQQQYQQQDYRSGQHQQQATPQYGSEDEEGQQVAQGSNDYDSDQEVDIDQDVNDGYSSAEQGQQDTSGQYSGGGYNYGSDY
ncbi:ankyrin 3 [Fusarium sp. NRRL 52700]|nr:ankyrin 3 [Fusarium sp. NRRL 52700]